ncbi:MAG TPA: CvfD/Ygs/GSP13 family RNA-binding post-transcriptional regulator [Bacilli bacterium]|nr:CvfD/Ygs/GSP13 family RNA-binding post-transcriptional regulator [Bacilli bacterium]
MTPYEKGKIAKGTITGIENYGAFVSLDEYYTGLIHISEISHGFVKDINDFLKIGETIYVEVLDIDEETLQLKLSIKNIHYRKKQYITKRKIKETSLGFKTLSYRLPMWIEESLKKQKNV